jgi:hypothetical protein
MNAGVRRVACASTSGKKSHDGRGARPGMISSPLGGPDNLLSGSRSDKRRRPQHHTLSAAGGSLSSLLLLRSRDNKVVPATRRPSQRWYRIAKATSSVARIQPNEQRRIIRMIAESENSYASLGNALERDIIASSDGANVSTIFWT